MFAELDWHLYKVLGLYLDELGVLRLCCLHIIGVCASKSQLLSRNPCVPALQLCKSMYAELDRHLHEVLGPRLDELGMLCYGQEWPQPPQQFAR